MMIFECYANRCEFYLTDNGGIVTEKKLTNIKSLKVQSRMEGVLEYLGPKTWSSMGRLLQEFRQE